MPLKLVEPRAGKTPYWSVRGTYLGIHVERSTKTTEKRIAAQILRRWKGEIERGEYAATRQPDLIARRAVTWLDAAVAYMKAGGERKHLSPIIELRGPHAIADLPLEAMDQITLDNAAAALYPAATAQTRNRQFYTPVIAVLRHGGVDRRFRRPKGWRGKKATSWLRPEQAFALFAAADAIDREFGLFLRTLCYTGMRLGEALASELGHLDLAQAALYLPDSKNGEARTVHLPPVLVAAFASQPPRPARPRAVKGQRLPNGAGGRSQADAGVAFLDRAARSRIFRFHAGGQLRAMLAEAMAAAGIVLPPRQRGFHVLCHTYGTWLRRFGGLDNFGMTRTKRWLDPRSADRYMHTEANEESRKADLFPVAKAQAGPK